MIWMRRTLSTAAVLSWALWLGGMIALFIFVQTLFARSRPLAVEAAPVLFSAFERYQLVLAGATVLLALAWWVVARRRLLLAVVVLLVVAAAGAVAGPLLITSRMEALRAQGQSGGPEFRRLHGQSMMVYVGQAVLLAGTGLLLPAVIRGEDPATAQSPSSGRDEPSA